MDGHYYHCFCVILIDCFGFLIYLPTFGFNQMSRSRKGLWSSGIKRMDQLCVKLISTFLHRIPALRTYAKSTDPDQTPKDMI